MTQDRKEYKLHLLRSQVNNPKANYRKYLVNLYNYYVNECKKNNADWCVSNLQDMYKIITVGCHKPSVSFTACNAFFFSEFLFAKFCNKMISHVLNSL